MDKKMLKYGTIKESDEGGEEYSEQSLKKRRTG
jgi:hypothetical protein